MLESGYDLSELSFTLYCRNRVHSLTQRVKSIASKHPRLTTATVLGTALFGGYLLYQWFQRRQQHRRLLFRTVGNDTQQTSRSVQFAEALHDSTSLPYELIKLAGEYDFEFRGYRSDDFSDPQELWRSNHGWQSGCKKLSDTRFICKGSDGTLQIWDSKEKRCVEILRHGPQFSAFTVVEETEAAPTKIVTASNQELKVWKISEETKKWECEKNSPFTQHCTPEDLIDLKNGKIACRVHEDGPQANSAKAVYIFNLEAGTWEAPWNVEPQPQVCGNLLLDRVVDFVALPHERIAISSDSSLRIYDSSTKAPLQLLEQLPAVHSHSDTHLLALSYGKKLAYASMAYRDEHRVSYIKIFDTETGQLLRELGGHTNGEKIIALGEAPDGNLVSVIGSSGKNIDFMRVWDVDTGNCINTIKVDATYQLQQLSLITFPRHLGVPWWDHFVLLQ